MLQDSKTLFLLMEELHFFFKNLSFNNCSLFGTNYTNENSFINSMFKCFSTMDMKTMMAETYNADLSSSKQVCLILIKQSYQKFEFTKLLCCTI